MVTAPKCNICGGSLPKNALDTGVHWCDGCVGDAILESMLRTIKNGF